MFHNKTCTGDKLGYECGEEVATFGLSFKPHVVNGSGEQQNYQL